MQATSIFLDSSLETLCVMIYFLFLEYAKRFDIYYNSTLSIHGYLITSMINPWYNSRNTHLMYMHVCITWKLLFGEGWHLMRAVRNLQLLWTIVLIIHHHRYVLWAYTLQSPPPAEKPYERSTCDCQFDDTPFIASLKEARMTPLQDTTEHRNETASRNNCLRHDLSPVKYRNI